MKIKKIIVAVMLIVVCAFVCPNVGYASEEMSDEFKAILTDGKLVVPSVKPTSAEEAWMFINAYLKATFQTESGICYEVTGQFEENDYSRTTVCYGVLNTNRVDVSDPYWTYYEEHIVDVEYKYTETNPKIKDKVMKYVHKVQEDSRFTLHDLEIINFWKYGKLNAYQDFLNYDAANTSGFCGEFKKFLDHTNLSVMFDEARGGWDDELLHDNYSGAAFGYDGVYYGVVNKIRIRVESVIYVPDDVEYTKETLLQTAQERINNYLQDDTSVVLSYGGLLSEVDPSWYGKGTEEDLEWGWYPIDIEDAEHYFVANVNGLEHKLLIIPNSKKMYTPTYKSLDLDTNVEISTDSSSVPLDTLVQVGKIEHGKDFDRIKDILRFHNTDSFDLKLHSFSGNRYIEKLDNGNFRVRIPIKEELKGKKLSVYYIDDNGKKHEHEVKIEGDYACFDTNHFSIYTLADTESVITDNVTNETSPKTSDGTNVTLWVLLLGVASTMLVYCNKQKMRGIKNISI